MLHQLNWAGRAFIALCLPLMFLADSPSILMASPVAYQEEEDASADPPQQEGEQAADDEDASPESQEEKPADEPEQTVDPNAWLSAFKWREVGPTATGGRV